MKPGYMQVPLLDETRRQLERLAKASPGKTPELIAQHAIEYYLRDNDDVRRRIAEAAAVVAGVRSGS